MLHLENGVFTASIAVKGAELKSLKFKKDGQELIWPGKPGTWERSSPVLFPVVGKSRNNSMNWEGKTYPMPQHGFARDMDFELLEKQTDSCRFVLRDSEESRKHYPYSFELQIAYRLTLQGIEISYLVRNTSASSLLFSLGTHPGFILPTKNNEDYRIEFDSDDELFREHLDEGFLNGQSSAFPLSNRSIHLNENSFKEDAWVFTALKSNSLYIKGPCLGKALKISWKNFPYLGIWSKYPGQEFICIEPWQGLADYKEEGKVRKGLVKLESGEHFEASLHISIEKN